MRDLRSARLLAGGVVLTVLSAAACASGADQNSTDVSSSESQAAFLELIDRQLSQAAQAGASQDQIALLEQARPDGELSFALAKEAYTAFFSCLDDAGIRYEDLTNTAGREFPRVEYNAYASDPTVLDTCFLLHADFVDTVYQVQPAVEAEVQSLVVERSQSIVACLLDAGYAIAEEPSYDELRSAAYFAYMGFYPEDADVEEPAGFVSVDCYGAAGLTSDDYHAGPG